MRIGSQTARRWMAIAALVMSVATPAQAEPVEVLEAFSDWAAVQYVGGTETLCFATSRPTDIAPKPAAGAVAQMFLAFYPKEKAEPEISFKLSFTPKKGATLSVGIGAENFKFVARDDRAFPENPQIVTRLIATLRKSETLVIRGASAEGPDTLEVYSLSGVSGALDRAKSACVAS